MSASNFLRPESRGAGDLPRLAPGAVLLADDERLKAAGAQGIVEYPLNKIVL